MKKKNLFLAALLLAGMNCPTVTNTATEGAGQIASWLSPKGFSWTTIGVVGGVIGTGTLVHRIINNGFHSTNQVGIADVNPSDIKDIIIKVKMGSKTASIKLSDWNQRERQGKATFKQNIENQLKLAAKTSADFTYEVSLILNNKTSVLLTKPLKESDVITLTKGNAAQKDFAEVLWTNVISHAFVFVSDCKNADDSYKTASALPHANKFDITYKAEITQMDCTLSPHTLVKAAPLALVARFTGFPTNKYALGAYAGAYVTSKILGKKLGGATRGINFELPKKKRVLESDTDAGLNTSIDQFLLRHSAKNDSMTLEQWVTERNRLKNICESSTATPAEKRTALRELANHAQLEKTFKITRVAILTDKVSGLTLKYATPTEKVTTGALRRKKVLKLSDFDINPIDRDYWHNAKAAYEATLSGIYNGLCFLSPFGDEDDNFEVDGEELEL